MSAERRAVIDVGTNSIKLLVAEVDRERVRPLHEESRQTRLGRGFFEAQVLQPEAIRRTAQAVSELARLAAVWHPASLRVIATSAARDARNAPELVQAIQAEAGWPTTIITGEQEAEWVFRGVATDPAWHEHRLLILDVGGGSTEIILGERSHHFFRQSFPLGSVRLLEQWPPSDPPTAEELARCRAWLKQFFDREVGPAFELALSGQARGDVRLVGTGGTTTILACLERQMDGFDREAIERTRLSRDRVSQWVTTLWGMTLAQRQQLAGLPPERADVILMGVAIYEAVMAHFALDELGVSTRGLRFGAVLEAE